MFTIDRQKNDKLLQLRKRATPRESATPPPPPPPTFNLQIKSIFHNVSNLHPVTVDNEYNFSSLMYADNLITSSQQQRNYYKQEKMLIITNTISLKPKRGFYVLKDKIPNQLQTVELLLKILDACIKPILLCVCDLSAASSTPNILNQYITKWEST